MPINGNGAAVVAAVDNEIRNARKHGTNGRARPVEVRYDDVANADQFLHTFGDEIKYLGEAKKWLIWDGTRWKLDKDEVVFSLALTFARDLYSPEFAIDGEGRKHAQRSNTHAKLLSFLSIAQKSRTVSADALDTQPYLINCKNGTLSLRTGELRTAERSQLITKVVGCDYEPDAGSPRFERFLETIQPDPAIRAFIQRSIGYSLLGTVRERSFWILYGIGANGKSVFLNLISKILGDYASGTSASSIMSGRNSSIPNDIARLRGQRFVVIPETEENERLNAALVKALSAGDTVTARFLFGEFFDFPFTGKLWIATNHKPTITDHSKGMWDRLKLVPFNASIPAEKVVKSDDLIADLMDEAPGIFAWAVQGCRDYFEVDGLDTPPAIQSEIDAYRWEQDSIAQFIEGRCETIQQAREAVPDEYVNSTDFRVNNSDLYKAYKKFCDENGEYLRSHRKFTQNLRERGFLQGNASGRFWDGLRLIDGSL